MRQLATSGPTQGPSNVIELFPRTTLAQLLATLADARYRLNPTVFNYLKKSARWDVAGRQSVIEYAHQRWPNLTHMAQYGQLDVSFLEMPEAVADTAEQQLKEQG